MIEPAFVASYYGTQNLGPVSDPLPTVTTKDRFALVLPMVTGQQLDIRFRMLQPHEPGAAMSFPLEYVFTATKGDAVRQIGNAVDVRQARALCLALLQDRADRRRPKRAPALEAIA